MNNKELLELELDRIIDSIQDRLSQTGTDATGETSKSLRRVVDDSNDVVQGAIYARKFFKVVETGRRATPTKKPSREMIANITRWAKSRGLGDDAVWAIATKINKEGSELFKKGGRKDIFTPSLNDEAIDRMVKRIAANTVKNYANEIRKTWQSQS